MFTFRTSITLAVMTFVIALAGLLIAIQARSLRASLESCVEIPNSRIPNSQ
jgi:adenylate cyclase